MNVLMKTLKINVRWKTFAALSTFAIQSIATKSIRPQVVQISACQRFKVSQDADPIISLISALFGLNTGACLQL